MRMVRTIRGFLDCLEQLPTDKDRRASGNANVRIRIDANPGARRSATLIIAGEPFALTQEASKK